MAEYTQELHLKKPSAEDYYDIQDFNDNADVLDEEVSKRASKVSPATPGNLATLTLSGDLADSGKSPEDFSQGIEIDAEDYDPDTMDETNNIYFVKDTPQKAIKFKGKNYAPSITTNGINRIEVVESLPEDASQHPTTLYLSKS